MITHKCSINKFWERRYVTWPAVQGFIVAARVRLDLANKSLLVNCE
jgi:hypothetical protein